MTLLAAPQFCHAYETDQFTNRLTPISDSTALLDEQVNIAIAEAIADWKGPRKDWKVVTSLKVVGTLAAGGTSGLKITTGEAVRITTGAPLPDGADAVLSEEFCRRTGDIISAINIAESGRNIQVRGKDIRRKEPVAGKGAKLSPALIGLLAAAGHESAKVYSLPRVAVIGTGDEVVAPGNPLPEGKLYASNMVEICSWLSLLGIDYKTELVSDRKEDIETAVTKHMPDVDLFITTGGAWGSEKDLILDVVEKLNWRGLYHRVRMGPGKPVGFGLLHNKPFFFLPGGPPSNEIV